MLHCIHFALSSPILLEGGAQEGIVLPVYHHGWMSLPHMSSKLKLTPTR